MEFLVSLRVLARWRSATQSVSPSSVGFGEDQKTTGGSSRVSGLPIFSNVVLFDLNVLRKGPRLGVRILYHKVTGEARSPRKEQTLEMSGE